MVALLLPGVLETLGGSGTTARSAEVQDLVDYNGALAEENQTLRESMSKAICSPDGTYDVPPSGEVDTPHTQDDIDERLEREGAEAGAIEVTLAWDGPGDLDLSVTCPDGGVIAFGSKNACGGKLDVDMNANDPANASEQPIEHVTWPENAAPPGEYKVNVNYFQLRGNAQSSVPYTVDIKVGDAVKRLSKTAECCGTSTFVDSFIIGAPGTGDGTDGAPETPPSTEGVGEQTQPLPVDPQDTVIDQNGTHVPLTDAIERGVVLVVGRQPESGKVSLGSGFFISDRRVVTNRHVIEGTTQVFIVSQALGSMRPVQVIAQTPNAVQGQLDFAVLETEAPVASALPLTVTPAAERLQQVISAGFPGFILDVDEGFQRLSQGDVAAAPEVVTTEGIIARPAGEADEAPLIMHSADIAQGNSGGPLLDLCGRVLGVNTLVIPGGEQSYHASWALGGAGLLRFLESNGIAVAKDAAACTPGATSQNSATPPAQGGG